MRKYDDKVNHWILIIGLDINHWIVIGVIRLVVLNKASYFQIYESLLLDKSKAMIIN